MYFDFCLAGHLGESQPEELKAWFEKTVRELRKLDPNVQGVLNMRDCTASRPFPVNEMGRPEPRRWQFPVGSCS